MAPRQITLYVQMATVDALTTLLLFEKNPDGSFTQVDGDLSIGREGAQIKFQQHPDGPGLTPWHFNECVVHPVGPSTARVDLNWYVQPGEVWLEDVGPVASNPRSFSYTLSVETNDDSFFGVPTKIYLDPKLVNTGGT